MGRRSRDAFTELDAAIGRRVRAARIERGLSQGECGAVVGVVAQQVSKYELGRDRLPASTVVRLAEALQVPVLHLLGEA